MAFTNYYEKYGFQQTEDLQKIQFRLFQLIQDEENDSFGEYHAEKLADLKAAYAAFSNAEKRAEYDRALLVSNACGRGLLLCVWHKRLRRCVV
ncbi:MAG: hypothetical protein LBQ80_04550 [Clostridium sp.]|nr:hypothetical protein [Clostridium sp.]